MLLDNFNKEHSSKIGNAWKLIIYNIKMIPQWRQPEKEIDSLPETNDVNQLVTLDSQIIDYICRYRILRKKCKEYNIMTHQLSKKKIYENYTNKILQLLEKNL